MSRKRDRSILQDEIDSMDLAAGVQHALSDVGLAMAGGKIFAGSLPIVIVIALGQMGEPVAEFIQEFTKRVKEGLASGQIGENLPR